MEGADAELHSLVQRCRQELHSQGYCVVPNILSDDDMEALRLEADTLFEVAEEERQRGSISAGSSGSSGPRWGADAMSSCIFESIPPHRCTPQLRSDYAAYRAVRGKWPLSPSVWRLLFQSRLTQLVLGLLGPGAALFNDQYILKPPEAPLSAFSWHRDSDWCRSADVSYQPYISVWCALDDMTLRNGCFVVRPGSHRRDLGVASSGGSAAPRQTERATWQRAAAHGGRGSQSLEQQRRQQAQDKGQQQQRRQQAQDQGHRQQEEEQQQQQPVQQPRERQTAQCLPDALPLQVPAGTAIVTSDTALHCSGPNRSQHMRRAWMPQFSSGPLLRRDGSCVSLAVPLAPPTAVAEAS